MDELSSAEKFEHAEVKEPVDLAKNLPSKVGGRVHSVKSVREHTIPPPHTTATNLFRGPTVLDESAKSMSIDPGEGEYVPEHLAYSQDQLKSEIEVMKAKIARGIAEPNIREKVLEGLRKASSAIGREVGKGELKVGKKSSSGEVNKGNIMTSKRKRGNKKGYCHVKNIN